MRAALLIAAVVFAVGARSYGDMNVCFTQPIADGPTPGNISVMAPSGPSSPLVGGLEYPSAIAFDPWGNLFFADRWSGTVTKFSNGMMKDIGNVWDNWPAGGGKRIGWDLDIAVDGTGKIYFTQPIALNTDPLVPGNISVMSPAGVVTEHVAGLEYPSAISVAGSGNLYFADRWSGTLTKRAPGGGLTTIGNIWTSPSTSASIDWDLDIVAADSGDVYFTVPTAYGAGPGGEDVLGNVSVISPAGVITVVTADLDNPTGIVLDGGGNLYFVERTSGDVTRRTPGGALTTFGSVWATWPGGGTRIGWDLDIAVPLKDWSIYDYDGDGDCDADDLEQLCHNMGMDPWGIPCDFDGDGDIDEDDFRWYIENVIEIDLDGDGLMDRRGTRVGDFNLDGIVNGTDLAIIKVAFGQPGQNYADGNANCDAIVNATDLAVLKVSFGFQAPTGAVPEPASAGLVLFGAVAALTRRRRSQR